jgi:lipopolysaccharide transport system ATP-binding protein
MQTGRESIFTKLALMGQVPDQIAERVDAIIDMAELGDVIDSAVCTYSSGMRVRLAFAIYANVDVDVFIVDDSMGVADVRFAQRMQRYWQDFIAAGGTLLLASHEIFLMRSLCRRSLLFDHGRIVGEGDTDTMISEYLLRSAAIDAMQEAPAAQQAQLAPVGAARPPETSVTECADAGQGTPAMQRFSRFSGSGAFPVRITAIETEADPDVGPASVQVLGRLTVRIHCESDVAKERVLFGLEVFNAQKKVAIHVQGPDEDPQYRLNRGCNVFSATLFHLPLMPGEYSVCAGLIDSKNMAILGMRGWEEGGDLLTVLPSYGNDLLGAISREALMTAPVVWTTDSLAEPKDDTRSSCPEAITDAVAQQ